VPAGDGLRFYWCERRSDLMCMVSSESMLSARSIGTVRAVFLALGDRGGVMLSRT
jgi:hypothetical protein